MNLRERLIEATIAHIEGKIAYHKANVEVYLTNPAGIGEHPDIIGALLSEMKEIAEYPAILEVAQNIPRKLV